MLKNKTYYLVKRVALGLSLSVILFRICAQPVIAQDLYTQSRDNFTWVNLGMGIGSSIYFDTSFSMAGVTGLTFQSDNTIISIRSALCSVIMDASISDVAGVYGWVIKTKNHSTFITLGAGLSMVSYADDGESLRTFGIPLEVQLFYRKTSHVGFYGFANINPKKIFYGVCLCLRIGRLRK